MGEELKGPTDEGVAHEQACETWLNCRDHHYACCCRSHHCGAQYVEKHHGYHVHSLLVVGALGSGLGGLLPITVLAQVATLCDRSQGRHV